MDGPPLPKPIPATELPTWMPSVLATLMVAELAVVELAVTVTRPAIVYVGASVGDTVGAELGDALGSGVGEPTE